METENYSGMTITELEERLSHHKANAIRYGVIQLGKKLSLNSAYGALGSPYGRFYDVRLSESITLSGQLSIRWIVRILNDYLCKLSGLDPAKSSLVVAGDTDSCYFTFELIVDKIKRGRDISDNDICNALDKLFKERIQPIIEDGYKELSVFTNSNNSYLEMDREVIATTGLWKAKKSYALNVLDLEGVRFDTPYQKVMGLASVRNENPEMCRDAIKEVLRLILNKTEADVQHYIKEFKKKFMAAKINDIVQNKSVNGLEKYDNTTMINSFKLKTPYHVKAALNYNQLIVKKKITHKYNMINSGDKIKLIYIKVENPLKNESNAIAFHEFLPPELNMDKFIDKNLQYEKVFFKSTRELVEVAGMQVRKIRTLY